jgi:ABC-2 type transport system permease protein
MRLFWELSRLSFRRQFTYRAANLAGLATNLFFGLLRVAVMVALFGGRPAAAGYTLAAAITFTGLSQGAIAFQALFGWDELAQSVYSGEIAADLLKPLDYFLLWLARDLGRAAATFLLRGVTIMALYALLYPISVPRDAAQWLALAAALVLAWLTGFAWRFLVNLAAFWTPNAQGVARFAYSVALLLSGFMLPLRFFPDWFQQLCAFTPFPALVNTIVEIYLGVVSGPAVPAALATQALWAIALIVLGQFVLRAGVRRLVILGG